MKYVFTLLILASLQVQAVTVYTCKQPKGAVIFSDKPCPKGTSTQKIQTDPPSWIAEMKAKLPEGIKILETKFEGGEVVMKFNFSSKDRLVEFMKMVFVVSERNANLMHVKMPVGDEAGEAFMRVSAEKNPYRE